MKYEECRKQAIADLTQYKYLKSSITVLTKQLQLMRLISANNMDNNQNNEHLQPYKAQASQIKETIRQNKVRIQCIEHAIAALPQKDQDNLNAFYINRYRNSVKEMARKEYTDRSTLYRRAQRSVDKYIFAYFGVMPPSCKQPYK